MSGAVQPGQRRSPAGTRLDADATRRLELAIARILQWGIGVSVALIAIGVGLMLVDGISPLDPTFPPFDPRVVVAEMRALEPAGFLWLGLALTIATPSVRVAASLVGYLRQGDRRMALVAVGILAVIALSVVVAGTGGG
jgi:uncharacterized membrane protein